MVLEDAEVVAEAVEASAVVAELHVEEVAVEEALADVVEEVLADVAEEVVVDLVVVDEEHHEVEEVAEAEEEVDSKVERQSLSSHIVTKVYSSPEARKMRLLP